MDSQTQEHNLLWCRLAEWMVCWLAAC